MTAEGQETRLEDHENTGDSGAADTPPQDATKPPGLLF
jgi:hypothetical protein